MSLPLAGVVGLGALAGSGLVRATRVAEADILRPTGVLDSVVAALAELGASVYTVVIVQTWLLAGDEHDHFASVLVVPLRWFEESFTAAGTPPGGADTRIFNVKINVLNGPFGGSPVAEGYQAFGWLGVVVVMAVLGAATGWVVRRARRSPTWLGCAVVVAYPLLLNVRNSFAPVPFQLAFALLLVLTAQVAWSLLRRDPGGAGR